MKKLLAAVLALTMALGIIFVPGALAVNEKEVMLFETNFESEKAGSAPVTVKGMGGDSAADAALVCRDETTGNQYINTAGKSQKRFRMLFNEAVSDGVIVAEFDLNASKAGNTALGMIYEGSLTTYAKWPLYVTNESREYVINGHLATNGLPPADLTGKTANFTKAADNTPLTYTAGKWQHYKVVFDFDKSSVTAYVDNVKSETISGYEYFGGKNTAVAGLAFYINKPAANMDSTMFDNIKIYKQYAKYLKDIDFEDGNDGADARNNDPANNIYKVTVIDCPDTAGRTSKVVSFNNNDARLRYKLNRTIKNEPFCIEFDVRAGYGGLGISLLNESDDINVYNKFVFSSGTYYSDPSYGLKAYTAYGAGMKTHPNGNPDDESQIKGYTKYGTETKMALSGGNESKWNHIKLYVDPANSRTRVFLDGTASNYIEGFTYLKDAEIRQVCFQARPSLTPKEVQKAYIDNLKVYTISDGIAVTNLLSGSKQVKLTFKDTLDESTINNISLYTLGAVKLEGAVCTLSDDKTSVTVSHGNLEENGSYFVLLDGVKYADGNKVCETRKDFTYTEGKVEVTIGDFEPSYTAGSEITVNYTFGVEGIASKNVELIVASYNDGSLSDVKVIPTAVNASGDASAKLTLNKNCTEIRAFAWEEGSLIPLVQKKIKTKN